MWKFSESFIFSMVSTDTTFWALAMAIVRVDRVGLLVLVKTVVQDTTDGVSRIYMITLDGSKINIICHSERS